MAKNKNYNKGNKNKGKNSLDDKLAKKPKIVNTINTEKKEKKNLAPTRARAKAKGVAASDNRMLFSPINYYIMLGGLGLILIGFFLMSGGAQKSPDVWDPKVVYAAKRITIAPIFILAGLGTFIYAIFKKQVGDEAEA